MAVFGNIFACLPAFLPACLSVFPLRGGFCSFLFYFIIKKSHSSASESSPHLSLLTHPDKIIIKIQRVFINNLYYIFKIIFDEQNQCYVVGAFCNIMVRFQYLLVHKTSLVFLPKKVLAKNVIFHKTIPVLANEHCMFCLCCCANTFSQLLVLEFIRL